MIARGFPVRVFAQQLFAIPRRYGARTRCARAALLFIMIAATLTAANAFDRGAELEPTLQLAQAHPPAPTFDDVLQFVRLHGWRANLDKLCTEFGMPEGHGKCMFRQISIRDETERGYPRGLNISDFAGPNGPYVLIFHLTPLFGEFFIVSTQGELLRAFYRAKGRGYDSMPREDVLQEFKADRDYWVTNRARLKLGFESSPAPIGRQE